MPPITLDEFETWKTKTLSMAEPTRTKFLNVVAGESDTFEEFASQSDRDIKACVMDMDLGRAAKNIVADWFGKRGPAEESNSVGYVAMELSAKADADGLTGKAKQELIERGVAARQRAMPLELGKSPWCQTLYVYGNHSSKLGLVEEYVPMDDRNVKGLEEDEDGKLSVKGVKAYESSVNVASLAAFLEWEAANKRACYRFGKDPLVEQISKYDLFIQQLAAISWGLAVRYHLTYMVEGEGKLEKTEDPAIFLRTMLVWQAEGQPDGPPAKGWTIGTAKFIKSGGTGAVGGAPAEEISALKRRVERLEEQLSRAVSSATSAEGEMKVLRRDMADLKRGGGGGGGGVGGGGGAAGGGGGGGGGPNNPVRCYECGEYGHIGRFCPKRTGEHSSHAPPASEGGEKKG